MEKDQARQPRGIKQWPCMGKNEQPCTPEVPCGNCRENARNNAAQMIIRACTDSLRAHAQAMVALASGLLAIEFDDTKFLEIRDLLRKASADIEWSLFCCGEATIQREHKLARFLKNLRETDRIIGL